MEARLTIDCKNCLEDITFDIDVRGKEILLNSIREQAKQQGWHIGRDCYCPSCLAKLTAHCKHCEHYDGNRLMGAAKCRLDDKFALPMDYCKQYKPRDSRYDPPAPCEEPSEDTNKGYKNPIPTLDD